MTLAISDAARIAREHFGFVENYEASVVEHFGDFIGGARTFVDVGANRGFYAFIANEVRRDITIYLIEADPMLAANLNAEVQRWSKSNGNQIIVLEMAAGDGEAILPFYVGYDDTLGSFVKSELQDAPSKILNVPVRALDTIVPASANLALKIDVEGFEYRVLRGASSHLASSDCKVLVELHGWGDPELRKLPFHVLRMMCGLGYCAQKLDGSHYVFVKGTPQQSWANFLRVAPPPFIKMMLRNFGGAELVARWDKRKRVAHNRSDVTR